MSLRLFALAAAGALALGWQALAVPGASASAAVAGGAATSVTTASATPDNLAVNGGFESGGIAPWTQYPADRVQVVGSGAGAGDPDEGERFAELPAGSSLSQTVSGLQSSHRYVVSGYARADSGVDSLFVALRYFDGDHANVVEAEKHRVDGADWTRFEIDFQTDATHSVVGILAQNSATSGDGAGYLDDVAVVDADPPADPTDPTEPGEPVDGVVSPGDTTYYVSSSEGDDDNDGLSAATAWKSVAKVNASTFAAGDHVLLKAGDSWEGVTLHPQGSGTVGRPITLGRYGSTTERPHIDGGADITTMDTYNLVKGADSHLEPATQDFSASVHLDNQEHWVVRDLDVSNRAPSSTGTTGDSTLRTGILVLNHDAGTLHDIQVLDNDVHDVLGDKAAKTYWGSAGIMFTVMLKAPDTDVRSNYDGVLVDGNYVHTVNRQGIVTNSRQNLRADIDNVGDLADPIARSLSPWYPSTDVVIRDNYVSDVAGDGILPQVTEAALVEHNTVAGFNLRSGGASAGIWAWNADDTVFQENEASGGHSTQDGQGYDVDYGQTGTVYQYNYSHDNDGGFMLLCAPGQGSNDTGPGSGVTSQDAVIRYNVSQNDRARSFMFSGYSDGALIYNNTIYVGDGIEASPVNFWAWNGTYPTSAAFYDNVFYLDGAARWNYVDQGHDISDALTFDGNTIYGQHTDGEPDDPHKLTSDPGLVAAGTGTTTTVAGGAYQAPDLGGYALKAGSSSIGSGVVVETAAGTTVDGKHANGGRDYAGTAVAAGTKPDRGAFAHVAPSSRIADVSVHDGQTVSGTARFDVTRADPDDVSYTYIELNRGGTWVTDNTTKEALALGSTNAGAHPRLTVDTTTLSDGSYRLKVDAVGKDGGTTERTVSFIVHNAPSVSFVAPANGSTVSGEVQVSVALSGDDLQAYNLRIDSEGVQYVWQPASRTYVASLDTASLELGPHTLLAAVTDTAGRRSTATLKIVVAARS
ncbi:hypothetical protein GCM10025864_17580 [Luteimicrobium album]|uniref:CBM-cenC domain-containing protein n=1 Tax=Luteimicrobium album TaxID=1054550 RepID=A0ABQ6I228_9MICO|nr:right-handed parallel beta-helix repeat-containing protein [Luteimicrobium album]GMA23999.1 hypothetical protein GCM10025864_17580 [Luteimicrobium album]